MDSLPTIIISFNNCVSAARLLRGAEFSRRHPEVAQSFNAIAGTQLLIVGRRFGEEWRLSLSGTGLGAMRTSSGEAPVASRQP